MEPYLNMHAHSMCNGVLSKVNGSNIIKQECDSFSNIVAQLSQQIHKPHKLAYT